LSHGPKQKKTERFETVRQTFEEVIRFKKNEEVDKG